jgi:Spy/CpxP family protein refolding chaperone
MKKLTRLFLNTALVSTLFLGYNLVRAQDQTAPADNTGGDKMEMKGGPGEDGEKRMDRLKEKLGLTDTQAKKLKAAMKKEREANKPLLDQAKIDMDTLQQKVDSKASDDEIKALLDKLMADHKAINEAQENGKEKFRTILTPMQQAKWVLMMKDGMGRGKWGGKKGDWKRDKKDEDKPADDASAPAPTSANN